MLAKAEAPNKESKSRSDRTLASYANEIANNELVAVVTGFERYMTLLAVNRRSLLLN